MNLEKIFQKQKKLDKKILQTHEQVKNNLIKNESIIALLVELGELANEIQFFKYWKIDKKINRNKILEEYSDGIHFLSSFAINLNVDPIIEPIIFSNNLNNHFLELFYLVSNLKNDMTKDSLKLIFQYYLGIAKLLNISEAEIFEEYDKKNKINYERIKNNY